MKTYLFALALLGLAVVIGCKNEETSTDANTPEVQPVSLTVPDGAKLVSFDVPGMTCEGCSGHVHETLAGIEGVGECQVDLESKTATCVIFPEKFEQEAALAKLADEGYESTVKN